MRAWFAADMADPNNPYSYLVHRFDPSTPQSAMPQRCACSSTMGRSSSSVRPASQAMTRTEASRACSMVRVPSTGTSKRKILARLAHLDEDHVAFAQPAAPFHGRIGAFKGLDRDDRAVLHEHALADVEPADFLGDAISKRHVGPVVLRESFGPAM